MQPRTTHPGKGVAHRVMGLLISISSQKNSPTHTCTGPSGLDNPQLKLFFRLTTGSVTLIVRDPGNLSTRCLKRGFRSKRDTGVKDSQEENRIKIFCKKREQEGKANFPTNVYFKYTTELLYQITQKDSQLSRIKIHML